ncbi:DUF1772 domain-containing protein [Dactylosporangium fulvum]|uniref:DUF1772 domain-containing protein n=1 Tax=Dactylosporangium fulvum TaxID=53359 RepID=A0ABY5W7T0_9ACTN|nr:DUF1772 domain-containing protein [Dactylosporangium fulvum]UWP86095.1 DUF1772 domain-containing protein [Dactylosporangium fulvum]
MSADVLAVAVLLGSGVTAGVLFAVALSVVPALAEMPADRYVYTHQMLGRNWDPTMPVIVLGSAVLDLVLAATADSTPRTVLGLTGAVLLLLVSAVSHLCNVPLNRSVKSLTPSRLPADWTDPRPAWRRWHLLRTVLALAALAVNATGVAVG